MTETTDTYPRLLADGLWAVGIPHCTQYVVRGEQAIALIGAGPSAMVDEVVRQLEALKIRPVFFVVTDPHTEHITGLPGLLDRYANSIVISAPGARELLLDPDIWQTQADEERAIADRLRADGFEPGRGPLEDPPSMMESLVANDGDEMDLGGRTLQYMIPAGPQHGNLMVHVPEIKALILSDPMEFRAGDREILPLFCENRSDYSDTLDRLETLDLRILGQTSQDPITGTKVIENRRGTER